MDYGTRKCLTCGKEFTATYVSMICCSQDCQKLRNKKLDIGYHKRKLEKYRLLETENAQLKQRIAELEKELEELKSRKDEEEDEEENEKEDEKEVSPQAQTLPKMNVCERLHLKQMSPLPCGKRPQCHYPMPCKQMPKGMTKKDITQENLPKYGSQLLSQDYV